MRERPHHLQYAGHVDFPSAFLKNLLPMELLLNLAWLLLALPACLLWRRSLTTRAKGGASSLQCLLALSCMLVLLFPIVSATDDLHALRAVMEESSPGKRGVRQAAIEKASAGHTRWHNPPAAGVTAAGLGVLAEGRCDAACLISCMPVSPSIRRAGRAPPHSLLG
jgi:hypothetical protein